MPPKAARAKAPPFRPTAPTAVQEPPPAAPAPSPASGSLAGAEQGNELALQAVRWLEQRCASADAADTAAQRFRAMLDEVRARPTVARAAVAWKNIANSVLSSEPSEASAFYAKAAAAWALAGDARKQQECAFWAAKAAARAAMRAKDDEAVAAAQGQLERLHTGDAADAALAAVELVYVAVWQFERALHTAATAHSTTALATNSRPGGDALVSVEEADAAALGGAAPALPWAAVPAALRRLTQTLVAQPKAATLSAKQTRDLLRQAQRVADVAECWGDATNQVCAARVLSSALGALLLVRRR